MNHQEVVQKISDRCGKEFSIVDEIIGTLLALATEQFTSLEMCDDQNSKWLATATSVTEVEMISASRHKPASGSGIA